MEWSAHSTKGALSPDYYQKVANKVSQDLCSKTFSRCLWESLLPCRGNNIGSSHAAPPVNGREQTLPFGGPGQVRPFPSHICLLLLWGSDNCCLLAPVPWLSQPPEIMVVSDTFDLGWRFQTSMGVWESRSRHLHN